MPRWGLPTSSRWGKSLFLNGSQDQSLICTPSCWWFVGTHLYWFQCFLKNVWHSKCFLRTATTPSSIWHCSSTCWCSGLASWLQSGRLFPFKSKWLSAQESVVVAHLSRKSIKTILLFKAWCFGELNFSGFLSYLFLMCSWISVSCFARTDLHVKLSSSVCLLWTLHWYAYLPQSRLGWLIWPVCCSTYLFSPRRQLLALLQQRTVLTSTFLDLSSKVWCRLVC